METETRQDQAAVTTEDTGANRREYSQDEINQLIEDRLNRERKKFADYEDLKAKAEKFDAAEEAQKSELQKATERADSLQAELTAMKKADEIRAIRAKVSEETGIPANLLTADTEDGCTEQAKAIAEYKAATEAPAYPKVKDGGDPQTHTSKRSTRDQFAEWINQA